MFSYASNSRPSTSAEIAAQLKFLEEWDAEHKEAEQKSDSLLTAMDLQIQFQTNLKTAQEEFQQRVEAATKKTEQESNSIEK